jgi:hypothetical protein
MYRPTNNDEVYAHALANTIINVCVNIPRTPYGYAGTLIYPISIGMNIPSQETNTKK